MPVTSGTSAVEYTGTGAVSAYTIPFKFFANGDVVVTRTVSGVETVLSASGDYTLTGAGSDSGGTVHLAAVLASGATLRVERVMEFSQPTDFRTQGAFAPTTHTKAFDRVTMLVQQAVQQTAALGEDTDEALAELRADFEANPAAAVLDARTVLATSSTTARTLAARFADTRNVKDFGAAGDGTADDTTEIQAAIDAAYNAGGGLVLLPPGTYRTSATLVLKRGVVLQGIGRNRSGQGFLSTHGAILKPLSDFGDLIRIEKAANGAGVFDLGFQYPGITTGSTSTPSTHAAIVFTKATTTNEFTEGVTVSRCDFWGMGIGILMPWDAATSVLYSQYYYVELSHLNYKKCNAALILNGMSDIHVSDIHISDCFAMNVASVQPKCAPLASNASVSDTWSEPCACWINDLGNSLIEKLEVYGANGDGCVLQDCVAPTLLTCTFAINSDDGLVISGCTAGSRIIGARIALNDGNGVFLTTDEAGVLDLFFLACEIEDNGLNGVEATPAVSPLKAINRLHFIGCDINNNSQVAAGTYDGLNMKASKVFITGGSLSDTQVTHTQKRAFNGNYTGVNSWVVSNCNIEGNTASPPFSLAGKTLDIRGCIGFGNLGLGTATPALPGGTGSANKVTNTYGYSVWVYHTGGVAVALTDRDGVGPIGLGSPNPVLVRHGDSIQFDTTVPSAWRWFGA